mmetsp:Transcript_2327/g.6469  ORF Transcript_2327/g.6469 Transcript_2327/m.6469 type:complete len:205 (-) Transcript_2327:1755-2369(-)
MGRVHMPTRLLRSLRYFSSFRHLFCTTVGSVGLNHFLLGILAMLFTIFSPYSLRRCASKLWNCRNRFRISKPGSPRPGVTFTTYAVYTSPFPCPLATGTVLSTEKIYFRVTFLLFCFSTAGGGFVGLDATWTPAGSEARTSSLYLPREEVMSPKKLCPCSTLLNRTVRTTSPVDGPIWTRNWRLPASSVPSTFVADAHASRPNE